MNKIKILSIITVMLICCQGITAQKLTASTYRQLAKTDVDSMTVALSLTEAQQQEVTGIMEKFLHALSSHPPGDSSLLFRKERLSKANEEKESALKRVLTGTQWKVYDAHMQAQKRKAAALMEERKKKFMERQNGNG